MTLPIAHIPALDLIADDPESTPAEFFDAFDTFITALLVNPFDDNPVAALLSPQPGPEDDDSATLAAARASATQVNLPGDVNLDEWVYRFEMTSGTRYLRRDREHPLPHQHNADWEYRLTWRCHREGRYESKAGKDPTKKPRLNQKESKKIGCRATIVVVKRKGPPPVIKVKYSRHNNHHPGSEDELGKDKFVKEAKEWVAREIKKRLDGKEVTRLFIKKEGMETELEERRECKKMVGTINNTLLTWEDVYDMLKKVIEDERTLDSDEERSLKLWKTRLEQSGHLTLAIEEGEDALEGRLLGFQSPMGKALLPMAFMLLLHGPHQIRGTEQGFFSILAQDTTSRTVIPVAHLIVQKITTTALKLWLQRLLAQNPDWHGPSVFFVGCDRTQIEVIREVFPDRTFTKIMLIEAALKKEWERNANLIHAMATHLSAEDQEFLEQQLLADIEDLRLIQGTDLVNVQLSVFLTKWKDSAAFIAYFRRQWLNNPDDLLNLGDIDKTMWMDAYRMNIPNEQLNTNVMIDFWNRHLRHIEVFANGRLDKLIYETYVVLNDDARHQRRIASLRAGRTIPMPWEIDRRKKAGETLSTTVIQDGLCWRVSSGATDEFTFSVIRDINAIGEVQRSFLCTCFDFSDRGWPCKHVYAVFKEHFNRGASLLPTQPTLQSSISTTPTCLIQQSTFGSMSSPVPSQILIDTSQSPSPSSMSSILDPSSQSPELPIQSSSSLSIPILRHTRSSRASRTLSLPEISQSTSTLGIANLRPVTMPTMGVFDGSRGLRPVVIKDWVSEKSSKRKT